MSRFFSWLNSNAFLALCICGLTVPPGVIAGALLNPGAHVQDLVSAQTPRYVQSMVSPQWLIIKDGNPAAMELFRRHYTYRKSRDQLKFWPATSDLLFVGPGEKLVLLTPCGRALFAWRLEKFTLNGQTGVNCAIFRNEGAGLSSELIRAADGMAWKRWPGQRLYTYVDPVQTRRKRDPGRCFLRADWQYCGWTKGGLRILEHCAVCAPQSVVDGTLGVEDLSGSTQQAVQSGRILDRAQDVLGQRKNERSLG